jgi:nicotinamidase/pyrazinamidase
MTNTDRIKPQFGDALIVVDVQNDFLPGGSLSVPEGDQIVPILNHYIDTFHAMGLPIYFTRDWHPAGHCSFKAQGGIWPPHCVQNTEGAEFAPGLYMPENAIVISKAMSQEKDAYSGFEGTELAERLHQAEIERLFIGGLATDVCVLNTVKDAIHNHFEVVLLQDAIRAVNVKPGDGQKAEQQMLKLGARPVKFKMLVAA